jgi:hypothetical protein
VTPLDEVPDSTWFTNRNAARRLSPDVIRRGPALHAKPRDGQKWVVTGMKPTGVAIGLRARDETGDAFFLKFDPRGHDEVETGADVVVQRLLFAAGYNVPENDVVYVSRKDLSIAAGVTVGKRPLRDEDIDALLARAAREPDGRYRALASRELPGKPIGGVSAVGTRDDDPNDHIRHEDRRDMRGLYSLAAWLNHTDIKPDNTLEAWIPDAGDPSRGHVVHYLLDFGKALGAMARIDPRIEAGFVYMHETRAATIMHWLLGTTVPWEGIGPFPNLRGLGWIESERFDPSSWKPVFHWLPFEKADRFDKFWGARIVASFTRDQIRAALEAARYSDRRTVEYLERVLVERQRKTMRVLFREVAPLDQFEVRDGALCFVDLWTRHKLGGPEAMYTAVLLGRAGRSWKRQAKAADDGTVCFSREPADALPSAIEIRVARPGQLVPSTRVQIAAPNGRLPYAAAIERQ